MSQDVSPVPDNYIGNHTPEVTNSFTNIGSTISSTHSLKAEFNVRIGRSRAMQLWQWPASRREPGTAAYSRLNQR